MSDFFETLVFLLVLFFMLILSIANLVMTNAFGETCGLVHPYIFQIDVSSIDVQTGTKANAYINTIPTSNIDENFDTYLSIYTEDGALITSNDDFADALTSRVENVNIAQHDTIIMEVGTYADESEGDYRLSVFPRESGAVSSFSITINGEEFTQAHTIVGEIEVGLLVEYELSADQPVNILLTGINADAEVVEFDTLDTYLLIYDNDDVLLAENDDLWDVYFSSGIEAFPVQEYGTVYIKVATYDDQSAGTYNLIITPVDQDPFGLINYPSLGIEGTSDVPIREGVFEGTFVEGKIAAGERIRYTLTREQAGSDFIDISLGSAEATSNWESEYRFIRNDPSAPLLWSSCIEHYGYVDGSSFVLNQRGLARYGQGITCNPEDAGCTLLSRVRLNFIGQVFFYLMWPGLVIVLPIFAVLVLHDDEKISYWRWTLMLFLVALHVLTSSLLYVHLGEVSGIEALANFAYGILAGAATGSAIAFMTKVLENFSQSKNPANDSSTPPTTNTGSNTASE